jgi:hypothetical protein
MSTTATQNIGKFLVALGLAFLPGRPALADAQAPADRAFTLKQDAEVVASITAGCARCDWAATGQEAAIVELTLDGAYSQHLILTRGEVPATYRVMLGRVGAGTHHLRIARDTVRSAKDAGVLTLTGVHFEPFTSDTTEYPWLSRAPVLRARPGTVERFSDAPLLMYVETDVTGEQGTPYRYQYTVIFTNEDGGTPTDRLMATWGRTTDIEFVYGITPPADGAGPREEIQAAGHKWIPFAGPRFGTHPVLWVATDNNMVADHGPDDAIRFAPAPEMIALDHVSREAVMDAQPWTYAVTSAEMRREERIDASAAPESGRIPDPRRYATVEGCGEVHDATLAFDLGVTRGGGPIEWYPTDRGEPRFRIARGGCFRGGAPLPEGVTPSDITALRVRAYTRPPREGEKPLPPGTGRLVLQRINRVFMLDRAFVPSLSSLHWTGTLNVPSDAAPVVVSAPRDR